MTSSPPPPTARPTCPAAATSPIPRSYGTFPRKIRYALDDKVLTLEQAIRSCSGCRPKSSASPTAA